MSCEPVNFTAFLEVPFSLVRVKKPDSEKVTPKLESESDSGFLMTIEPLHGSIFFRI